LFERRGMGTETNPLPTTGAEHDVVALRFGPFELDLRSGEMRRAGVLVRLQPQPFKVLALLAGRAGELVTREEIQKEVWPVGTFVDFEQSLNFCIRQIRSALGDSALSPRFVETLPRRGYRFNFGPVETVRAPGAILEWRRPAPLAEAPEPPPAETIPAPPPARPRLARGVILALLALALGALALSLFLARRPRAPEATARFHRLTYRRGSVESARFAADGQVVYSASFEGQPSVTFLSRIETREVRPLTVDAMNLVGVSPQGELAFLREGTLARAPLAGGPAKEILDRVDKADWSADGKDFVVVRGGHTPSKVEYPLGTVLCEALWPSHLRISPDGQRVAFLEHPLSGDDRGHVVVVDRKGRRQILTEDFASSSGLAWSPGSDEIYFTAAKVGADSSLHAVTLDGKFRTVLPAMGRLVLHDISPQGRLLMERMSLRNEIRFRRLAEKEDRDLSWLDLSAAADLSPDGSTLLFYESGEGGGPEYSIFLRKTDGSLPVRLGPGRANGLSADGKWALSIPLLDPGRIDVMPTGPGEIRSLRNPGVTQYDSAGFLGDGQTIFFTERHANGQPRAYVQDLSGGPPRPALPEGIWVGRNSFSADGRLAAGLCPEKETLCMYPVGGGDPRPVPGLAPGAHVAGWDASGHLYVSRRGPVPLERVFRVDPETGRQEAWTEVAPPDVTGVVRISRIVVSRSGNAYAYSYQRRLADLYVVENVR
jgi:eukaryotic-like serine/threonine-protein kinase